MRESIHRSKQKETYQQAAKPEEKVSGIPNSSLEAVMAGKTRASSEMMGHRQDLAPSLAAKMSKAFGMDLSRMQVYRSGAMQGTGMQGMASGNKIVLSRDIDLNTMAGQAVLGHEISHVHAQSQGIGMGHSGLYDNASLEQQADVEGMMAARGQSILGESTGMETGLGMGGIGGLTPLSPGMSASAGAPMQAKDKPKGKQQNNGPFAQAVYTVQDKPKSAGAPKQAKGKPKGKKQDKSASAEDVINGVQWKNGADDLTFDQWCGLSSENVLTSTWGLKYLDNHGNMENKEKWTQKLAAAEQESKAQTKLEREQKKKGLEVKKKPKYDTRLGSAEKQRLITEFVNINGNVKDDLIANIASTDKKKNFKAQKKIKELHYQELLRKEKKWGKLLQQMDIDDLVSKGGAGGFAADIAVGLQMGDTNSGKDGYKFKDKKKEARYQQLNRYFSKFSNYMLASQMKEGKGMSEAVIKGMQADTKNEFLDAQQADGKDVIQNGPSLSPEQLEEYKKSRKKA